MTDLVPLAFDEQLAIDRTSTAVAVLLDKLDAFESRTWLETELLRGLREGRLALTIKAVEGADMGDEIADAALRQVGGELQIPMLQKQDLAPGHLQVVAYLQRVATRAPHRRKRGRHWADDWRRDHAICLLIELTRKEFGIPTTRHRESRRAARRPSAISIVTAALGRNGIHIDEGTIQRHIWFGMPGELARQEFERRPVESYFAV
jgi:hypothetical protein